MVARLSTLSFNDSARCTSLIVSQLERVPVLLVASVEVASEETAPSGDMLLDFGFVWPQVDYARANIESLLDVHQFIESTDPVGDNFFKSAFKGPPNDIMALKPDIDTHPGRFTRPERDLGNSNGGVNDITNLELGVRRSIRQTKIRIVKLLNVESAIILVQ